MHTHSPRSCGTVWSRWWHAYMQAHSPRSCGTVWSGWWHAYMQARTLTLESWNGLEWMVTRIHARTITSESWNGLERMVTRIHARTLTRIHARTYTYLRVVERFGADGYWHPQVDAPHWNRGMDPQRLQLLVRVAMYNLNLAQVLRLVWPSRTEWIRSPGRTNKRPKIRTRWNDPHGVQLCRGKPDANLQLVKCVKQKIEFYAWFSGDLAISQRGRHTQGSLAKSFGYNFCRKLHKMKEK